MKGVLMRVVKTIPDVQKALNELFSFKDQITSKALDLTGRQIKNGASATDPTDFVIKSDLPVATTSNGVVRYEYTIVFSKDNPTDDDFSPPFLIGLDRDGLPCEIWLSALGFPNSGNLAIDVLIDREDGLGGISVLPPTEYLTIKNSGTQSVWTSKFVEQYPKLPLRAKLYVHIITAGGAEFVSVGVIVRRRRTQNARSGRN